MSTFSRFISRSAIVTILFAAFSASISLAQSSNDQQLPAHPEPQAPSNPPAAQQVPRTAPSTSATPPPATTQTPPANQAQAAPIIPAAAERHYHAGRLFEKDQNYDNAMTEYRAAIKEYSDYVDARYRLANLLINRQDYTNAISELRDVVMLKPNDANAHNDLGYALKKNGDAKGAAAEYFQAIRI